MSQHNLHLVAGKKPPRARVRSMAKGEELWTRRDELPPVLLAWLLSHAEKPVAVELFSLGSPEGWIAGVVCGHGD